MRRARIAVLLFARPLVLLVAIVAILGPRCFPSVRAQNRTFTEIEKIETLIKHIESLSDATFIRNGKEYDARAAARFLRAKWKASSADVKTARRFIEKVASMSSTTGKPYLIRFRDGREVKTGDYLVVQLKKLENPSDRRSAISHATHDNLWADTRGP